MNKNLKFLFAVVVIATMFSSCKKKSDLSIVTSHKWYLSASTATFSDSTVTHNLIQPDTICQTTSYTEFHDRTANNPLRLADTYITTNCSGYTSPDLQLSSWDIDADNTVFYLGGNTTDGQGGTWYNLQTLSSSSMVLTIQHQESIGTTGYPNYTPIYHVVTYTQTYSVK